MKAMVSALGAVTKAKSQSAHWEGGFVTWLYKIRNFSLLYNKPLQNIMRYWSLQPEGLWHRQWGTSQINSPSMEVFRFRLSLYFSSSHHSQWDFILQKTQLFSGSAVMNLFRIVAQGPWAVVQDEFWRWNRRNALWQCCYCQNTKE